MKTCRNLLSIMQQYWSNFSRSNLRPFPLVLCLLGGAVSFCVLQSIHHCFLNRSQQTRAHRTTKSVGLASSLCDLCRSISLEEMRGPKCDRMQRHQPSYLALKQSAMNGCQLCGFICIALGQCVVSDGETGSEVLEFVSEKYPGREISLACWGSTCPISCLDRVQIITSGEVPDTDANGEPVDGIEDPTMHPDHQCALSGVLDIFTYPGINHSIPLPGLTDRVQVDFCCIR